MIEYIPITFDTLESLMEMEVGEVGELIHAAGRYFTDNSEKGNEPEFSSAFQRAMWKQLKNNAVRARQDAEERSRKNSENGKKGAAARYGQEQATPSDAIATPSDANQQSSDAIATHSKERIERKEKKEKNELESKENKKEIKEKDQTQFEEFWQVYPRKDEKAAARTKYQQRLKDGYSPQELIEAAKQYAAQCSRNHTERQYIKMARTFLGPNGPIDEYLKERQSVQDDDDDEDPFAEWRTNSEDSP